jgi:hypothetical protein
VAFRELLHAADQPGRRGLLEREAALVFVRERVDRVAVDRLLAVGRLLVVFLRETAVRGLPRSLIRALLVFRASRRRLLREAPMSL